MDNKPTNKDTPSKFINKIYDKLSFFDLYGNNVIIFILITLFVFLVYSYCKVMQKRKEIASDWVNQRCKPQNIAFAGYITHPEGTTPFEYTNQNFQYCVQNILTSITGYFFLPFQYLMTALSELFMLLAAAIQQIRIIIDRIRNSIFTFAEDVMGRILNIMIPVQQIFISLMDALNKVQGVMASGLFTMLGTYYTLQALLGAILELIIKILIILAILIVGLWILPFTWPVASIMSIIFLAIAIPLAIIIYFMTEVLHVKADALPELRCFDRKTRFTLADGTNKCIEKIKPGNILLNGSRITAKIKVTSKELHMYNLNGIIVSGNHKIKYNNTWISVKHHPNAIKIQDYNEPYLYCLNTTTKTIHLNNITFADWDEIYEDDLDFILHCKNINTTENISKTIDKGFDKNTVIKLLNGTKSIDQINIGDILNTKGIVYGIVELDKKNLGNTINNHRLYHLLVTNGFFETNNKRESDYNNIINSILELRKILS